MNRRNFLAVTFGAAITGGCANSPLGKTLATAGSIVFGSADFDAEYVNKTPYASLSLKVGTGKKILLILLKEEKGNLHWVSGDRGILVTRNGRIIRTLGLPENIQDTRFLSPDISDSHTPFKPDQNIVTHSKRSIDLQPGNRFESIIESFFTPDSETKDVQLLGRNVKLRRWREECRCPELSWQFENAYWVDDRGLIWLSRQHISPKLGYVEIEITKPYNA